jgi:hypothetical protein
MYKTHHKRKTEQEDKLRALKDDMTRKVQQLENEMDARVQQAVAVALSQQQAIGAQPDVVISPASQRHSSCASTAAPGMSLKRTCQRSTNQRYLAVIEAEGCHEENRP